MKVGVAILAAGSSSRFGADKVLLELGGRPVWDWSVRTFRGIQDVCEIVIVAGENRSQIASKTILRVVSGGQSRQLSSRIGVEALMKNCDVILVHDAARPFIDEDLVTKVIDAAHQHGAAALVTPVPDTIRQRVDGTATLVDRSSLQRFLEPRVCLTGGVLFAIYSRFASLV